MLELYLAFTLHLATPNSYNEVHPHIRYEEDRFITGLYLNSVSKPSAYAGVRIGNRVWTEVGLVTGYPMATVVPLMRSGVDVTPRASAFAAPLYDDDGAGVLVGIEYRLW